jgi:hypothetical protein
VAMHIPVGPDVTKESPLLVARKGVPYSLHQRTDRVHHSTPGLWGMMISRGPGSPGKCAQTDRVRRAAMVAMEEANSRNKRCGHFPAMYQA